MELRLIRRQRGIRKVVSKIKNNDIPSIPKYISQFAKGIQPNLHTDWKVLVNLSNSTHNIVDITHVTKLQFNAILCALLPLLGKRHRIAPIIGNKMIVFNRSSPEKGIKEFIMLFIFYAGITLFFSPVPKEKTRLTHS